MVTEKPPKKSKYSTRMSDIGATIVSDAQMIDLGTQAKTVTDQLAAAAANILNTTTQITNNAANTTAGTAAGTDLRTQLATRINTMLAAGSVGTDIATDAQCKSLTDQIRNNDLTLVALASQATRLAGNLTDGQAQQTALTATLASLSAQLAARIDALRAVPASTP